jgi:1,4-dihydroxy-6-naphthoate synthase
MKIQVGHSPDADDAFMFYALTHRTIDTGKYEFEHILKDIETLNRWALEKRLEVSALSVHAYSYVAKDYALLPHGASIGDRYGPIVVAKEKIAGDALQEKLIAVPGELTTAFLALSLCLGRFRYDVIPFDQIFDAVKQGKVDAGLIIHEGQLTYPEYGFQKVLDLGEWWYERTSLPLPLGINAIRKDLGRQVCSEVSHYLHRSIEYGLEHRKEALEYAMKYSRNTTEPVTDRFVGMYVNDFTRNFGERGRLAVQRLLQEGHAAGITPKVEMEFVD